MTNDFNLDAMCSAAMRNVLRFIHNATENARIDVGLDFLGSRIQIRKRHDDRMTLRSVQAECSPSDFKSYQLMKLGELFGLPYEGLAQDFEKIGYSASRLALEFKRVRLQHNEWIDPPSVVIHVGRPISNDARDVFTQVKMLVGDEMED